MNTMTITTVHNCLIRPTPANHQRPCPNTVPKGNALIHYSLIRPIQQPALPLFLTSDTHIKVKAGAPQGNFGHASPAPVTAHARRASGSTVSVGTEIWQPSIQH